jgi:CRISPR-associated endoribonuclease Cas6
MPYSLVLNLVPASPIYPQFLTGRHLHALFFSLVSHVDRELGDRLHSEKTEKAFTLSPLQVVRSHESGVRSQKSPSRIQNHTLQWEHPQPIPAGTPCWWRVSLLDDTLFGSLTQLWLNLNPEHPWHLGSADLHITSILGTPQATQPWANACTYTQLYEHASVSDAVGGSLRDPRQIALTFTTPTAFRQGQYDTALPTRDSVFNSLLNRWNKYSGIELSNFSIESIFPNFFNIRTEIAADSRSKFIGCVGEISYRLMGDVEPLQIKQINALADFALYAGIGRKTPMGMGMVRRLNQ